MGGDPAALRGTTEFLHPVGPDDGVRTAQRADNEASGAGLFLPVAPPTDGRVFERNTSRRSERLRVVRRPRAERRRGSGWRAQPIRSWGDPLCSLDDPD